MTKKSASERLKMLDQYIHALVERFYLRPPIPIDEATLDLNGSEFFALNLLGRKGKISMTELAEECALALSSMTGVVDRLVQKGCVRRAWDEQDRRKVYVALDKKGKTVYQQLLEGEMNMIIAMMDSLKPEEQDALLDALGKAAGAVAA